MKRLVLVLVLGLLIQNIPSRALATVAPPAGGLVSALGIGFLGLILFENHSDSTAKANGNEFAFLNDNPAFPHLLKLMAGGSLNTEEILKK